MTPAHAGDGIDALDLSSRLAWMGGGTQVVLSAAADLQPREFDKPSLLPDWSRRTLVAHLARNADALARLLHWARTGVETPMYGSPQQRVDEITHSARQAPDALIADLRASTVRLDVAVAGLSAEHWSYPVRSALGRAITAADVPWLRSREVWLHAIDLNVGVGVEALPQSFAVALIDDVLAARQARGELADVSVIVEGQDALLTRSDPHEPRIAGTATELAGWLTNRLDVHTAHDRGFPPLGPWI